MKVIRHLAAACLLGMASTSIRAEDLSPWFGGEDQEPFRLPISVSNDIALAAPLTTGSTNAAPQKGAKRICTIEDCNTPIDSAKSSEE